MPPRNPYVDPNGPYGSDLTLNRFIARLRLERVQALSILAVKYFNPSA